MVTGPGGGNEQQSGWLRSLGFIDFAGSTVVHSIGGWTALAGILIIGPRQGVGQGKFISSNLTIYALGVFLLFIGWFGFNGGSALAFDNSVPSILLNTFIGAAAGGTTMTFYFLLRNKTLNVEATLLGIIAGLVGVTAGCHLLSPMGSFISGSSAAFLCYLSDLALKKLKVDDVVSSFPAHGVAGAWGTLAVALFGNHEQFNGLTRLNQLGVQGIGVLSCFLWAFGFSYILMKIISFFFDFRVTPEHEKVGLNISEHQAYTHSQLLLDEMQEHHDSGNISKKVHEDPYSEIGQIAVQYNLVIERIANERQKQVELLQRIRQQSRENELIITSSSEAIIAMDLDHKIFKWNPEAITIFGWETNEVIGKNFFGLVLPEILRTHLGSEYLNKIKKGDPSLFSKRHELHLNKKNGYAFIAEIMLQKMDNGANTYICAFIRDITDRKNYEDSLIKMRDSALSVATMKSEFLATMSHEIRTPLNGIIGFAELLNDSKMDDEQKQYVTTISKSGKSLLEIINTILDYSKADANKMELHPVTFEVPNLINDVIQSFAYKRKHNFELGSYIDPNIKPLIHCDQQLLRQVLDNLFGNAMKFTEQGTIMIKVLKIGEDHHRQILRFEVTDTGIGIPMDKQSKLFDTFSQVDSSQKRKYGGTGLGLAYCKKIIELMKGQIGFTSEYGKGSTFWFVIRVDHDELPTNHKDLPLKDHSIVFWDDNKEMNFLLQSYLNDWGAQAHKVSSENELLLTLQQHNSLEWLILDEDLNDLKGSQIAQMVTQRWPKLKILILGGQQNQNQYLNYLNKPFAQSDLLNVLTSSESKAENQKEDIDMPSNTGSISDPIDKAVEPELMTSQKQVLYVEDNEDNRNLLSIYLKKWDISFDLAEDGKQGLDMCSQNDYQVILMDLQMPVMDGFAASIEIRKLPQYQNHRHLTALTASKPSEMEGNENLGVFNNIFNKPIDFPMIKKYLFSALQENTKKVSV